MKIRLIVNGHPRELDVEAHALLLDVLRDGLDLKGAKRSCDTQVCGACTVLVDGLAVSACTYLAVEADGRPVLTVEGLADGESLHPPIFMGKHEAAGEVDVLGVFQPNEDDGQIAGDAVRPERVLTRAARQHLR